MFPIDSVRVLISFVSGLVSGQGAKDWRQAADAAIEIIRFGLKQIGDDEPLVANLYSDEKVLEVLKEIEESYESNQIMALNWVTLVPMFYDLIMDILKRRRGEKPAS